MRKLLHLLKITTVITSLLFLFGCNNVKESKPSVKNIKLVENKVVKVDPTDHSSIVYGKVIDTRGYTQLRIFARIHNEHYSQQPLSDVSSFQINAFNAIGTGSWGYHSEKFKYRSTSGWSGVTTIPIVGDKTRIAVIVTQMKNSELQVNVRATLF